MLFVIAITILSYIFMPQNIVVQIDFSGNFTTTSYRQSVIMLFFISKIMGLVGYYFAKGQEVKCLTFTILATILEVFTLVFNLFIV